ncbi:MAG TPA: WD40 repeat domain-containing protein, partial [Polyangia bacterium]
HEMLLSTWPRLVEWRREDREGARLRDQLRDAARQWTERGRSPGLLWRDDALVELKLWRKKHEGGLSAVEAEFAAASLDAERRGVRRRRAGLVVGFVVMAAVSLVLWTLDRRAERATAETRARLVESYLAQARTKLLGGRRWEALASLVAAQKMGAASPAIDMMRALAREPARALERRWRVNAGRAWSVDYSPDGALVVTTGEDGAALWEAATGTLRARLVGHAGDVRDGGFSPDGAHVATIGFDATVRIWDGHTGAAERVLRGHRSSVRCMAWRPDGAQLLTTDLSGDVHVWDLASGASVFRQIVDSPVTSCSFAGSKLAFAAFNGDVFVGDGDRAEKIGHHDDRVRSVRFDRDGKRLVSAGADTTVRVWDVASRRMLTLLRGASEELLQASFSPDGARVVAASHDGTARVWDLASGQLQLTLTGHHGGLWSAAFDGTGTRILTSADDGSARLWDATNGLPLAVLEGHDKPVLRPRFSPDGAHVATVSYDGTAAIWKAEPTFFVAKVDGWQRSGMTSMSESRHRQ